MAEKPPPPAGMKKDAWGDFAHTPMMKLMVGVAASHAKERAAVLNLQADEQSMMSTMLEASQVYMETLMPSQSSLAPWARPRRSTTVTLTQRKHALQDVDDDGEEGDEEGEEEEATLDYEDEEGEEEDEVASQVSQLRDDHDKNKPIPTQVWQTLLPEQKTLLRKKGKGRRQQARRARCKTTQEMAPPASSSGMQKLEKVAEKFEKVAVETDNMEKLVEKSKKAGTYPYVYDTDEDEDDRRDDDDRRNDRRDDQKDRRRDARRDDRHDHQKDRRRDDRRDGHRDRRDDRRDDRQDRDCRRKEHPRKVPPSTAP